MNNKDESISYDDKSPLVPGLSVIHETRKSSNQLEVSNDDQPPVQNNAYGESQMKKSVNQSMNKISSEQSLKKRDTLKESHASDKYAQDKDDSEQRVDPNSKTSSSQFKRSLKNNNDANTLDKSTIDGKKS